MKYYLFISFTIFLHLKSNTGIAQNWESFGTIPIQEGAYGLYNDTQNNKLFAYGQVHIYSPGNPSPIAAHTVFVFQNGVWDTIDVRNIPFLGGAINDICWYKGKYYATGGFAEIGSSKVRSWAKYDNNKWGPMAIYPDAPGVVFKVIDDTLYIGGMFTTTDGIYSPGIIKFDGINYHGLDPLGFDSSGMNAPIVSDILNYHGLTVVCGTLEEDIPSTHDNLVIYENGKKKVPANWQIIYQSNLFDLIEYEGDLIVAGNFNKSDGVSLGNNIVAWDGLNWKELGGGCNGAITKMIEYQGSLIVIGGFTQCDGINAKYIAKWNGHQWCNLSNDLFSNLINDMAIYQDTLLVVGNFINLGSDSVNFLAKWTGGDSVVECGPYRNVGVSSSSSDENSNVAIYPNPTENVVNVSCNEAIESIELVNLDGKRIYHKNAFKAKKVSFDASQIPNSTYVLKIKTSEGLYVNPIIIFH